MKKVIYNLQDADGRLYGHSFKINKEHIIFDENGSKIDLKAIAFAEIYSNEMIIYLRNCDEKYLLAFEGIKKIAVA